MAITFDDEQATALLELLGLPADTIDVDTILATVKDAVTASTAEGAQPSAVAAAARRNGLEVLDTDTMSALRRDATEGRQIKAAAARKAVEDAVSDAITKGKITLSRRKHWVDLITADPGMGEVLAGVPNETAVPLTEVGHAVSSEDGNHGTTPEWFH
jgi:hypothetical protein